MIKRIFRGVCKFCTYLFWPQMGRQRRKQEQLKYDITYLIGKERSEGNLEPLSPEYISHVLSVPLEDVEKVMREMGM